ncbi:MAG: DUF116 domain-containing protein [Candidatus Altiarchaeales archaeon]|nr:DUF116 domain-containing protein [Candidatus Altiarchaeales archaeon]
MVFLGVDIIRLFGWVSLIFFVSFLFFLFLSIVILFLFWKTNKVYFPSIAFVILKGVETPLKYFFWMLKLDDEILDRLLIEIMNKINVRNYCKIGYEKRAVFFPQCLRHPKCPAPLVSEGLMCVACGKCGLGEIKKLCMKEKIDFFIAPGSTLVKRMMKKHKPKAVLGVGCCMEVKEGMELIMPFNLPVQGVVLLNDGCMDTRVDLIELFDILFAKNEYDSIYDKKDVVSQAEHISSLWREKK